MSFLVILRIVGLLLMLFSLTMVPPMVIARIYHDGNWYAFGAGMAIDAVHDGPVTIVLDSKDKRF